MHPSKNLSIRILDLSINPSIRILDIFMNLNIRTLIILMKTFFRNSKTLLHMRDYILRFTLMTKDLVIILWLNGGHGRLPQILLLSL